MSVLATKDRWLSWFCVVRGQAHQCHSDIEWTSAVRRNVICIALLTNFSGHLYRSCRLLNCQMGLGLWRVLDYLGKWCMGIYTLIFDNLCTFQSSFEAMNQCDHLSCSGCICDGGENACDPCTSIHVGVEEPQVVQNSGAPHCCVSHDHTVFSER